MNFRYGGGSSGGGGIEIESSTYNNITNNIIPAAAGNCVFTFTLENSHYNRIENNSLGYCGLSYYGTGIKMSYSNFNVINNNSFRNIGYKGATGLYLDSGSSNVISNNLINTTYFYGIGVKNGSFNRIENNIVGAVDYRAAITVESAPSTYLYKNTVFGSIGGIELTSSPGSVIDGNNASGNVYYPPEAYSNPGSGIIVEYSNDVNITNNYAESNGGTISGVGVIGSGIEIKSSNNALVRNNTAIRNGMNGIYIDSSRDLIIDNNNASYNGRSGTAFCTINYCYSAGIRFYGPTTTATATNNKVTNNMDYGFSCLNNTKPTLQDNYVISNGRSNWDDCPSPTGEPLLSCGNVTKNSVLIADLNSSGTCLNITADNVVLDCNNHSIRGMGGANTYGILASGRKNVVIKNCRVTNYSVGIMLNSTTQSTVVSNVVYNNSNEGIYLYSWSNDTDLINNTVYNNQRGIRIYYSAGNQIYNNRVYNITMYDGIGLFYVNNSQVFGNVVYNNKGSTAAGIYLQRSSYNEISNNNLSANNLGIQLDSVSTYNQVYENIVPSNSIGITITSSNYNNLYNNTITNNSQAGIYFSSSNSNATMNTVMSNPSYGIQCSGSPLPTLSANILSGNGNDLDACPQQISEPLLSCGTITKNSTLINNLTTSSQICINIAADNVVLDCNGHSITGPGLSGRAAVYAEGRRNLVIKNCVVEKFERGIQLNYSNSSSIYGNIARDGTEGISMYNGSSNNKVYNNTAYETVVGVYAYLNSNNNEIYNNTVYLNDWGVCVSEGSIYNKVYNNIAYNNTDGVYISGTSYANVSANTLTLNIYGVFVISSDSTVNIESNNIQYNTEYGVLCNNSEPVFRANVYTANSADCSDASGTHCQTHCYDT
jgi:parallel beta-helix repeat protein